MMSQSDFASEDDYTPPLFTQGEAWRLFLVFVLLFVAVLFGSALVFTFIGGKDTLDDPAIAFFWMEGSVLFGTLFMVRRVQEKRRQLQTEETLASYLGWFGFNETNWKFVLKWTLIFIAFHWLGGSFTDLRLGGENDKRLEEVRAAGLWIVTGAVIFAPVLEEILYRGIVYPALLDSTLRPKVAAWASSFMFALIHLQFDWVSMVFYTLLGMVLLRGRTIGGSLWVSMWLHALWNTCVYVPVIRAYIAG